MQVLIDKTLHRCFHCGPKLQLLLSSTIPQPSIPVAFHPFIRCIVSASPAGTGFCDHFVLPLLLSRNIFPPRFFCLHSFTRPIVLGGAIFVVPSKLPRLFYPSSAFAFQRPIPNLPTLHTTDTDTDTPDPQLHQNPFQIPRSIGHTPYSTLQRSNIFSRPELRSTTRHLTRRIRPRHADHDAALVAGPDRTRSE